MEHCRQNWVKYKCYLQKETVLNIEIRWRQMIFCRQFFSFFFFLKFHILSRTVSVITDKQFTHSHVANYQVNPIEIRQNIYLLLNNEETHRISDKYLWDVCTKKKTLFVT